jgi:cytoskeletal protein RodZ
MLIGLTKRGQSTLEYAVVIAVIVGALLATQVYIKRGIQGRFKQSSDDIGEQFSPGASKYDYTTVTTTNSQESTEPGTPPNEREAASTSTRGGVTTTDTYQDQQKTGTEQVREYDDKSEYWGD